ncbi:MAG: signal peptide peptidase SppA [Spirochaetota bacterium]|nr:signal peptide peptidase SppA [Spirochaetota bacterium]
MNKKTVLIIFITLYTISVGASIVILATGNKQQENQKQNKMSPFSSLTGINKSSDMIGVIKIDEPIAFISQNSSIFTKQQRGASFWLEQMDYATTNENVKAVIIRVNSPGGTVGASQELHAAVQRIKDAGKPVITSIADLSASGGYYATVGSDRMFANPGSLVGSIGVILGGIEFADLLAKLGIKYQAITSGKNKDLLSPYKKMSEEQRSFLQKMVNNTYDQFLTAVAIGRKKDKEVIRPLADGSVFTGEQAVENGLIDELGSFYDVVAYTRKKYDLPKANLELITPHSGAFNIKDLISVLAPNAMPTMSLIDTTPALGYSPVLYLYQF